ncbi:catalase [Stenotrophomonas pictorum JCM 9942]|uniref:Catalase-related peroxidase n=1 Tax=Stenotrophomonas pictorum JCM 9942 TaxID=1236960 RepID=A0A0R0AFH1_9GAMM|nr:catalase family peroxidase [Stenotrophomonas pictorum]KRG43808.1 catalase [Stenotrophomonas pictorum JCM 9942]
MTADSPPPVKRRHRWLPLAGIAGIAGLGAVAFAWSAGWIGSSQRLTASTFINTIEATGARHPGFRRAHSKGICVTGTFQGTAEGAALSKARVFSQTAVPVLGRMSIGGGDPHGADAAARVRSMALQLRSDDGQEWRMAMNSFPFFAVPSAAAFLEQTRAQIPDPATGKPDPAKMAVFLDKYPQARRFQAWAKSAPWSSSWANTAYNGIHSFRFINAAGDTQPVRWSMRPQAPFVEMDKAQRAQAPLDYLAEELGQRLAAGPVRWDMQVSLPEPGDAIDDPSQPWPENRQQVTVGTLTLLQWQPQADGACRDLNFDPLILPTGVEASDDPILAARSAVYAKSFDRREREIASGKAIQATGQGVTR